MPAEPKHILFITSHNLSSNPRCLKEIKLALAEGYKVSVLAFDLKNWSSSYEAEIKKELGRAELVYLPVDRSAYFAWLSSVLSIVFYRLCYKVISNNVAVAAFSVDRRAWLAHRFLRKSKWRPDMLVAHNPTVVYPAFLFAKNRKTLIGIDMEDYYPGENSRGQQDGTNWLTILKKVLPAAAYVSYASPLIQEHTEKNIAVESRKGITINNVFAAEEFTEPSSSDVKELKLLWFSQYINYNRGLEVLFPVLDEFSDQITLTLIGTVDATFYEQEIRGRKYINLLDPLSPVELNKITAEFDVGLAIEPGKDLNNELALSNKIWTYFQSGLYIVASDTLAQHRFMDEFKECGLLVNIHDREKLRSCMTSLVSQAGFIKTHKADRFKKAKAKCWENESVLLKNKWQQLLNS